MKIIKQILRPLNFIYDNYLINHNDLKWIWRVLQKEEKIEFKEKPSWGLVGEAFKEYAWVILLLIGFFLAGVFYGSQHYQDVCNQYIIDNFLSDGIIILK